MPSIFSVIVCISEKALIGKNRNTNIIKIKNSFFAIGFFAPYLKVGNLRAYNKVQNNE
jgi:hypothetical protein